MRNPAPSPPAGTTRQPEAASRPHESGGLATRASELPPDRESPELDTGVEEYRLDVSLALDGWGGAAAGGTSREGERGVK
uniref:Uncharacterized protein n=1 Tax=Setaria viridis TaxID=4556 RepID=A0A4U6WAL1_SETVI|nr:hypothetical protein SEVIR_1G083350v2 [Setaria viridis]